MRLSILYVLLAVLSPAPSAPASAQAFCQNVVWERPEFSNGDILRYLIKFRQNGVEITRQVPGDSNFFILPDNLPSRTVIMVRVYTIPSYEFSFFSLQFFV